MQRCISPENNIKWEFKGGHTTKQAIDFISSNIQPYVSEYGYILLILWTGTCDLSRKVKCKNSKARRIIVDLSDTSVN